MPRLALAAIVLLVVLVALMAYLSPAGVLNAVAAAGGGYSRSEGLAYGGGQRRSLDVYRPSSASGKAPVIVFLYGGGWEDGDKATYRFVGAALAARGYLTVIPDYRVYPEVRFPAFLQDAAAAVAWTKRHAAEFGGDPDRLVLMGHSAGAHIAAMLAYDRQWLAAVGLDPERDVRGLIGLAGPYDFLPLHSDTLRAIFGPPEGLAATQPITFVDGRGPPAFLATGLNDDTVDPGNTSRLALRIRERGGEAETRIYDKVDHRSLIGAMAFPLRFLAPVLRDVDAFARKVTTTGAVASGAREREPA